MRRSRCSRGLSVVERRAESSGREAAGRRRAARRRRRAAAARPRGAARARPGPAGAVGEPRLATQLRPAVVAGVDVLELEAAALEVLAEPDVAERAQLVAALAPRARDRLADAAQHDLPRDRVELQAAARRQEREVLPRPAARRRRAMPPSSARKRRSKRNSLRCVPTKSSTVQTLLPGAFRRPRPSCCRNSVGLSVGRSSSSVSTVGTSTPSLNRSTEKTTRTRPVGEVAQRRRCARRGGSPRDRDRRHAELA